ncbi:MAG: elongation factor Tu [Actinomycetota bacterium]|jgi:hypothetical protein|nr:elongation factor Tu [Actinomycetota bacterium]
MTGPSNTGVQTILGTTPWRQTGELSLRGAALKALPDLSADVERLVSLDVGGNRLHELPDWLWAATRLEYLLAGANRLVTVGAGIGRLRTLRYIDLTDNWMVRLPTSLADCQLLRRIDLSGNHLEEIDVLATVPLTHLDVANNRIKALSALPATLEQLDLSNNRLEALPDSFRRLRRLRRLDLSGNRLTDDEVQALVELPLEELYLDDNQLVRHVGLADFPRLRRLSAMGNPAPPAADDTPSTLAETVAAAVGRHISGAADPGRQFADPPTYSLDLSLAVKRPTDAHRLLDLYYKRFPGVPAEMRFGDGTTITLTQVGRGTALEVAARHHDADVPTRLEIAPTKDAGLLAIGQQMLGQAVARMDEAMLVPNDAAEAATSYPQPALTPTPRVLNIAVTDAGRGVLAVTDALAPREEYGLRIDIGALALDSVIVDPPALRLQRLQVDAVEGFWFDVVVSSGDFDVPSYDARIFLPLTGPSWVCGCLGPEHECKPLSRQPYLYLSIRSRDANGDATLRCTVYNGGNAVQSANLHCVVTPDGTGHGRLVGVVDYQLAEDVGRVGDLPPRPLNLLTAQAAGGTHQLTVHGGGRTIAVDLTEVGASHVLTTSRATLAEITLGTTGKTSQYDKENRKPFKAFLEDLKDLAWLGSQIAFAVTPEKDDRDFLRDHLRTRTTIQVTRVTKTPFPWALIYDIPVTTDPKWVLCPLLEDWETSRDALLEYPETCPHQDAHAPKNVLCPYGFWGFRHLIEQPPSVRGGVIRTKISVTPPAAAAMARSLTLDAALTGQHFGELAVCMKGRFQLRTCTSSRDVEVAFAEPSLPLVYFYCHGRKGYHNRVSGTVPLLEIGADERIGAADFAVWANEWKPAHWADTAPLIFINGCDTAALDPEDVVGFVDALAGVRAAGVIGTEIPVTQRVAGEVALRFWRQFAGAEPVDVGTAMHRTRIDLLRKGNVSGLSYTPFCSADLRLAAG